MSDELGRLPPPFNRLKRGFYLADGDNGYTGRAFGIGSPSPFPFNSEQIQRLQCRTSHWQFSCTIFDEVGGDTGTYTSSFTDQDQEEAFPTIASRREMPYGVTIPKTIEINTHGGEGDAKNMLVQARWGLNALEATEMLSDGGDPELFWPSIVFSGTSEIFYYETEEEDGPHPKTLLWGSVRLDSQWIEWGDAIFSDGRNQWHIPLYREPDIWEENGWVKVNDYVVTELILKPSVYLTA